MKVGDKVYCKKTFKFLSSGFRMSSKIRTWFIENKSYDVFFNKITNRYYLIDEEGDANDITINQCFDEYFCSEKEYRKLKLYKINEKNKER